MRLALAKQRANETFLIRHTFKRQFSYFKIKNRKSYFKMLCRPDKIIQTIPNSNQNKHGGNYVEEQSFGFELEEDTI